MKANVSGNSHSDIKIENKKKLQFRGTAEKNLPNSSSWRQNLH